MVLFRNWLYYIWRASWVLFLLLLTRWFSFILISFELSPSLMILGLFRLIDSLLLLEDLSQGEEFKCEVRLKAEFYFFLTLFCAFSWYYYYTCDWGFSWRWLRSLRGDWRCLGVWGRFLIMNIEPDNHC